MSDPKAASDPKEVLTPTERARRFSETAIRTPANVITFLRLLFSIPVLVWILDEHHATWGTFSGWLVLWLTDGLDGILARRDGTTSAGAFLDPLADKILVIGGRGVVVAHTREPARSLDPGSAPRKVEGQLPVLRGSRRPVSVDGGRALAARRCALDRARVLARVRD